MSDPAGRYVELLCHDMNNSLTVLYGQTALMNSTLEENGADGRRLREIAGRVEEQTSRVIGLVAEMRDAFRQADGEDFEEVELGSLLREAAVFVDRLWRHRAGQFLVPSDGRLAHVRVRPLGTRGALWRVFASAVDRHPRVRVGLETLGSGFRVIVAGSGGPTARGEMPDAGVTQALDRSDWRVEPWSVGTEVGWALIHPGADLATRI